jgi:UDP-N-acetylglucosamine--N-acetylmuramyl-(pentapeptide) pyrophosphoryl-undecaprenol N-acetylglucosamine transferase
MPAADTAPTVATAPGHALLAGGGTGGHVFPALAVADELLARGWRVSVTGSTAGLEARLAAERGLPFHGLPARPLLGRGPLARAAALATLVSSSVRAARLIRRLDAGVVLGTGGYVSAPAVLGARLAARPVLLLEPNAKAGVANRWLSRFANGAAVGYAAAAASLHCPSAVTGVPVRREFFGVPSVVPPTAPRLLVLGGSQGARQINLAVPPAAALLLAEIPGLSILHQAGPRHIEETRQAYANAGLAAALAGPTPRIEVVPFVADVAGAMASSHLLLSRAGALTVAEICAAGRPALLAPLAIAQAHQVDNALLLASAGAAEVVGSAAELEPRPLASRLAALLGDSPRLAKMGESARQLARPDAAAAIAGQLAQLAHREVRR